MKRTGKLLIIITAILSFMPFRMYGQEKGIDGIIDKYSSAKDIEVVKLSAGILSMLAERDNNDLLKDLKWIKILNLNYPYKNKSTYDSLVRDIAEITGNGYEELVSAKDNESDIRIYLLKKEKGNEFLIFTSSEKDCYTVINISGKISTSLTQALLNNEISIK